MHGADPPGDTGRQVVIDILTEGPGDGDPGDPRPAARLGFAADLTGLLFAGDGLLRPAVVVLLLAVAGALAYGYGVWLGTRYAERPATSGRAQLGAATWLGLAAYLLLGVFAFTFLYANAVGEGLATRVQAELARGEAPVVSIMSTSRLSFRADSVTELLLPAGTPDAPGGYRYRYDNLRLVLESADHLFLLPLDWAPEPGRAWLHIVPIADGMRIDIDAGPSLTEASG